MQHLAYTCTDVFMTISICTLLVNVFNFFYFTLVKFLQSFYTDSVRLVNKNVQYEEDDNINMRIYKAHNVSKQAESEARL